MTILRGLFSHSVNATNATLRKDRRGRSFVAAQENKEKGRE